MNTISTKELSMAQWRKLRDNFIGGSDAAAILGKIKKYKSPYMVWLEKTQNVSFFQGNPYSRFGTLFEPICRQHFRESMNMEVSEPETMFIHPDYPMLSGNVDGIIHDEGNMGLGILEIKCTTTHRVAPHELAQNIPIEYYTQLQHYMGILNAQFGFLQVYFRDICEFSDPIYIERDDELIKANNQRLCDWWNTYVVGSTPPPASNQEDLLIRYPNSTDGEKIEASPHIRKRFRLLLNVRERIKGLKELKESIELDIKEFCKDSEVITIDGTPVVTWKSSTRNRFDSKQFRKDHPELYNSYKTESQTRTFRIKRSHYDTNNQR